MEAQVEVVAEYRAESTGEEEADLRVGAPADSKEAEVEHGAPVRSQQEAPSHGQWLLPKVAARRAGASAS